MAFPPQPMMSPPFESKADRARRRCARAASDSACLVCSCPENASTHFGTTSCLACAAFFRRTVSLGIRFKCKKTNRCQIFYKLRIDCRKCRFDRCLAAGMKPSYVQKRKSSAEIDYAEEMMSAMATAALNDPTPPHSAITQFDCASSSSASSSASSLSPPQFGYGPTYAMGAATAGTQLDFWDVGTQQLPLGGVTPLGLLDILVSFENKSAKLRRMMYSRSPLDVVLGNQSQTPLPFDCSPSTSAMSSSSGATPSPNFKPYQSEDLRPYTLDGHHAHMRFDQMLAQMYTKKLPGFAQMTPNDCVVVYRYACLAFAALDIALTTCQMRTAPQGVMVFTDGAYLALNDDAAMDGAAAAQRETYRHVNLPLNRKFFHHVVEPLYALDLDITEYAALKALSVWRPNYELSAQGRQLAKENEETIVRGLYEYYGREDIAAQRVGNIILFIGNLMEQYREITEYYEKFDLFKLVHVDVFVSEVLKF